MVLLLVGAIVVMIGLVVFWIEPLGVLGVLERLTPNIVYRVRTKLPLVALSFDDGPHPAFTPQVLEILKRHEAKATFFLIGERALRYPEVVARIRAEGHEIGKFRASRFELRGSETSRPVRDSTPSGRVLRRGPGLFLPGCGRGPSRRLARLRERL